MLMTIALLFATMVHDISFGTNVSAFATPHCPMGGSSRIVSYLLNY